MEKSAKAIGFSRDWPKETMRVFAWSVIASLFIYLLNNYLILAHQWPRITALSSDPTHPLIWLQIVFYLGGIGVAGVYVSRTTDLTLRQDSARITKINTFLIRAAFWVVLYIGLADMVFSFIRVEGFLPALVGEELARDLGKPQFRGQFLHIPLIFAGILTAVFSRTLGFTWLALLIVIAELAIVITRFVFSYEQAFMGDLVRFWYAALFLFASAYTLLEEGHVRVDVFYTNFNPKLKGLVNALGSVLLGISVCVTIILVGMEGKASIINSPVMNFEVSQSGYGMYVKYLMASFLGVFAFTMAIQFAAYLLEGIADYRQDPGKQQPSLPSAH